MSQSGTPAPGIEPAANSPAPAGTPEPSAAAHDAAIPGPPSTGAEGTPTPGPGSIPAPAAAPAPAAVQAAPKKDWKDARIAELTAKAAKLRDELASKTIAPAPGESQADFDARVETRAAELVAQTSAQTEFTRQCNAVAAEGRVKFPDFDARLKEIGRTVDANDQAEVGRYWSMIAAANETGQAAAVLHELGGDVERARAIMALPALKMAVELTKLAATLVAPQEPSRVDRPIKPLGSNGIHFEGMKPDDPDASDKLPVDEWMKRREAQVRERGLQ